MSSFISLKQYLLIAFCTFISLSCFAQNAQEISNQVQQSIESERQNVIRSREIEQIKQSKEKSEEQKQPKKISDDEMCDIKNACRKMVDFEIRGASIYSKKKLYRKFINKYRDYCLTKFELERINKDINEFYLKNGFILARVYFDLSELAQGVIIIVIEEGKIEEIEIRDNSKLNEKLPYRRTLQEKSAFFGLEKDKVFNLRDFEQGIDQINRLSSQSAQIKIEPASRAGYSNIFIDNKISDLTRIDLTIDNSGNERSGRIKHKVALNQDNLISLNDNIYLNYSQSNRGNDNRYAKSFYSAFSMPLGYYDLGASYSYSEYKITSAGVADVIHNFGNSESKNFYVGRLISRGQRFKTNVKIDLDLMDTDNYIERTIQPLSSFQLSVLSVSLNNIYYIDKGSIYLQAKYSKGLDEFGATKTSPNASRDAPKAQFESAELYLQLSKLFAPKYFVPFEYRLTGNYQYGFDSLYGQRKIALGGLYSVRGFNSNVISGDEGYYLRNDIKIGAPNLFKDNVPKSMVSLINRTSFGVFYDYGYVRNKIVDGANDEGYMSGVGAAINFGFKDFGSSLTYSRGLQSPKFIQNVELSEKDRETIYFSFSYSFNL